MRNVSNTNVGDILTELFVQDVRAHMANSSMHSGVAGGGGTTDVATHNSSTTAHADLRAAIAALQAGGGGGGTDVSTHNSSTSSHADIRTLISALQTSLTTHTSNTSIHGGGSGTDVTTHNNDVAAHAALLLPDSALPEIVTAYSGSTVPTTLATASNNSKRISALQIAKLIKGLPTSSANTTNFDVVNVGVLYSAYNGARIDAIMPNTKFNSKAFVSVKINGWDANINYQSSGYDVVNTLMFVGPHDDVSGTQTYLYDWDSRPVTYTGIKVNVPIEMSGIVSGVSDNTKNLKVTVISRICNSTAYISNLANLLNLVTNNSASNRTLANMVLNSSSDLNIMSMGGMGGFASDGLSSIGLVNDYQVNFQCISVNK